MKQLYKIEEGRKVCGVCGGIARYLGIDPTVVRLLTVVSAFFFGITIVLYIAGVLLIPEEGEVRY